MGLLLPRRFMAATERRDRHSTEALLAKMEKAGEVEHVGRGQWAHPDLSESVVIVGKAKTGSGSNSQGFDSSKETEAAKSQRKTQQKHNSGETVVISKHNADETVVIPVVIPEPANPLADKAKPAESQHHNDHNGPERGGDPGPIPECLRRAPNGPRWVPAHAATAV